MKIEAIAIIAKLENGGSHEVLINKSIENAVLNLIAATEGKISLHDEVLDSVEIKKREI